MSQVNLSGERVSDTSPCLPEDSPASLSVQPGSEKAKQMTVISGLRCLESYRNSSPIGLLVRMLLESPTWSSSATNLQWTIKPVYQKRITRFINSNNCSSFGKSSTILSVQDILSSHSLFQLAPSMLLTEDTESSSLPTVTAADARGHMYQYDHNDKTKPRATLCGRVALLPTPNACDAVQGEIAYEEDQMIIVGNRVRRKSETGWDRSLGLARTVAMLPTPGATPRGASPGREAIGTSVVSKTTGTKWGMTLETAIVKLLPTVQASDAERKGGDFAKADREGSGGDDLSTTIAKLLPTPTTPRPHDNEDTVGRFIPSQNQKDLVWALNHHTLPTPTSRDWKDVGDLEHTQDHYLLGRRLGKNHGLRLQPAFAEWMMGFPPGWTDLPLSETPSSPRKSIRSSKRSQKSKG